MGIDRLRDDLHCCRVMLSITLLYQAFKVADQRLRRALAHLPSVQAAPTSLHASRSIEDIYFHPLRQTRIRIDRQTNCRGIAALGDDYQQHGMIQNRRLQSSMQCESAV
jgi:hypothetical protein